MRRSREREGACQNGEYKIGMPRKWNEEIPGEGRGMPKWEIYNRHAPKVESHTAGLTPYSRKTFFKLYLRLWTNNILIISINSTKCSH